MLNDQAIKGLYTELFVQKEFTRYGFYVSIPLFNAAKYDMIVDTGFEFLKIQVKKSRQKGNKFYFNTFIVNGGNGNKKFYSTNDIDYFATVWNEELYLIPPEETAKNEKGIEIGDETYLAKNVLLAYPNRMTDDDYYTSEKNTTKYCIDCGAAITGAAERCVSCANKHIRKMRLIKQVGEQKAQELLNQSNIFIGNGITPNGKSYPTREELKDMIRNKPFTQIGKDYGVTDNAIRKWCDSFNLPRKKSEINKYTEEEWKNK